MSKIKTTEVYLKDKITTRKKDIKYTSGKQYGIDNTTFNFTMEPCKEPFGDVVFTTGYDNNDEYTSTFLMTAEEAMELGKMLIDTAYEAMNTKRILLEAEACDTRLSFLVLKHVIDSIRIERSNEKLENYEPPFYKYIISAYKGNDKVYSFASVNNLSYFTKESEIDYWKNVLTDKERVKLYFDNWNPYEELKIRREESQNKILESLSKYNNIKPSPIKK